MITRRRFLGVIGAGTAAAVAGRAMHGADPDRPAGKPNILLIITDQQFADAMSCVIGQRYLHTPHMDSLADTGMRFTGAYSPNPLCMPMRASLITGRYPHETGVQANEKGTFDPKRFPTLGKVFRDAGYTTAYFGKWHIKIPAKDKDIHGFETFDSKAQLDPAPAAAFIKQAHDRPFLAVASFLSPHEICQWARKEKLPGGEVGDPPPLAERPPVRPNAAPPANETDIMAHMRKAYQSWKMGGRLAFPVGDYTEADWRRHIWGYYRLIERADTFIGVLLDALRDSGRENDTVVVFVADHGDCHGAHGWNQKTVFYDESSRVPLIVRQKGITPKGTSDLLVNVGVDILPTLCDFAGITPPTGLPGMSLKAHALATAADTKRHYVVSQNHMVQCAPINGKLLKPHGRMVRTRRYKYCLYSEGQRPESLVDMQADPGEMINEAANPAFAAILTQHRALLRQFAERHNDATARRMLARVEMAQK